MQNHPVKCVCNGTTSLVAGTTHITGDNAVKRKIFGYQLVSMWYEPTSRI